MTLKEAASKRHKVSKYLDKALTKEDIKKLNERIKANNDNYGVNIQLITDNKDSLPWIVSSLMAKGVNNYLIIAGPNKEGVDETLGYCGADLMLYAQTIGLNTWWVGGMYSRKGTQKNFKGNDNNKIVGIVAIGYGENQGVPHKSKTEAEVSSYEGEAPEWFKSGVAYTLLAPTAMNQQAFFIKGKGNKVSLTYKEGSFSGVDLGICKYHFTLGAGSDNFTWE